MDTKNYLSLALFLYLCLSFVFLHIFGFLSCLNTNILSPFINLVKIKIREYLFRSFNVAAAWPQIKCWSTYPHGSVAAWPQPLKIPENPSFY